MPTVVNQLVRLSWWRSCIQRFEEGDVGYIPISNPHYIENTGDSDLVFIEMFKSSEYQDISLAEWMAHTPHLLMNQHLGVTMSMLDSIPKEEAVVTPL